MKIKDSCVERICDESRHNPYKVDCSRDEQSVVKSTWMTIKMTCCTVMNHCPKRKFDQIVVLIIMSVAPQG